MNIHGALVEVGGVGVLLLGPSGVGKSECALELIRRGHRLVADDVVMLEVDGEGLLHGAAPDSIRHHLSIRGLGILYVPEIFSPDRVLDRCAIELICRLEPPDAELEQVGLDRDSEELAGVKVERFRLYVRPGATLATIVEVAAVEHQRRERGGETAARRLDERVRRDMRGS